jgi:O-antigen ligase
VFAGAVALQAWLAYVGAGDPVAFFAGAIFLAALLVSFRSTLTGVAFTILYQMRVLQGTADVGLDELAYALIFFATVAGWFLRRGPSAAGRDILNSPVSRALLVFLGLAFLSVVVTLVTGGSAFLWFRDFVRFSYLLLFFPLADVLRSRRGAAVVSLSVAAVVLFYCGTSIWRYVSAITETKALWQIRHQRAALHEVFAMGALVVSFAVFLRARRRLVAGVAVGLAFLAAATLTASLTRGYWLATALAGIVVLVLSPGRRRRAAVFVVIMLLLVAAAGYAVFSSKFVGVLVTLAGRASTIAAPMRALSVKERLAETHELVKLVLSNPVVGRGLGAEVAYMSPLKHRLITTPYGHNAYLFMLHKLGVVGLAVYLVLYTRGMRRVWRAARTAAGDIERSVMVAGFALLLAFLPLSVTSPQFYGKSSALVIALLLGAAEALAQRARGGGLRAGRPAP